MKVLVLYGYSASAGGLANQASLLRRGPAECGVEVHRASFGSARENERHCRGFKPDGLGLGDWGHAPHPALHIRHCAETPAETELGR